MIEPVLGANLQPYCVGFGSADRFVGLSDKEHLGVGLEVLGCRATFRDVELEFAETDLALQSFLSEVREHSRVPVEPRHDRPFLAERERLGLHRRGLPCRGGAS